MKRSTPQRPSVRAAAGSAALALCFGALVDVSASATSSLAHAEAAPPKAVISSAPLADVRSDPTNTESPSPISNGTWVDALFADVLGRAPTTTEKAMWVAKLDAETADPATIALELTRTDEWRADWIQHNYRAWLDRVGTPRGVAYWQQWMDRGLSPQGVQVEFLASDERWSDSDGDSTEWITGLYLDVLYRAPTASLLSHWNTRLNSGWSRSRAAQEFVLHRDFLYPLVEDEHEYMLDQRSIRPARLNHWVERLQSQARYERLVAGLAATDGYQARLQRN